MQERKEKHSIFVQDHPKLKSSNHFVFTYMNQAEINTTLIVNILYETGQEIACFFQRLDVDRQGKQGNSKF